MVKIERAAFAAGCFWSPDLEYSELPGVLSSTVGFMGGDEGIKSVSYVKVSMGGTGHAEIVLVEYDADKVSYEKLLEIFWKIHVPTQLNRQGLDIGDQYRSIIFYFTDAQRKIAEKSREKEQKEYKKKIVTEITPAGKFFKAEGYHQDYLKRRGQRACHI